MKIVIDIDENVFTRLFDNGTEDYAIVNDDLFTIAKSIRKGTPLPKGHGRLGDLDIILNKAIKHCESYIEAEDSYCRGKLHAYELYVEEVENADTIIKADKESEDKCKNCEYYRNPDYTRCHECEAESEKTDGISN